MTSRVAVVTGASRGIGRAIALALGADGWSVAVGFRSGEGEAKDVASEIEEAGGRAITLALDTSDEARIGEAFKEAADALGPVTGLVNNAGVSRDGLSVKYPTEEFDRTMAVNTRGAFLCSRAALRGMLRERFGRIVNISSAVALNGNAGQVAYAASKAAVVGMARSLAREVGSRGITVNVVCPGLVPALVPPPPPHAAAMNETRGIDMPSTVPRRMNSRRLMRPAAYSSMTWFSISFRCARMASTRRCVSSMEAPFQD